MLKTYIIIALFSQIKHFILIENHQQFKSQIQNYELQHKNFDDGKYSLNFHLFERLI